MPDQASLRRHAIQIVAQLPEEPSDALMVLELAKELVETFLAPEAHLPLRLVPGDVVAFPAASSSSRSASGTVSSLPL